MPPLPQPCRPARAERLVLPAALFLTLAAASAVAGEQRPQVRTHAGIVQGIVAADSNVAAYKGIPYATPPMGDLRWRPPVPAPAWDGVRDAAAFGHACPQPARGPNSLYFGDMAPASEDCLTLNVWTPIGARKLPVMVWIHGGSLLTGSSSEPLYDGGNIARQGIVFVSINYRLGVLGYLAHPALSAESPQGISGNYGLLDQVLALRWVRDNIEAFGGDPAEVTIAGESAGGLSVIALLASPHARGLFTRAIAQSGRISTFRELHDDMPGLASAEAMGTALAETANASNAAMLRAADPAALIRAGLANRWQSEPVIDGVVLERQLAETFARGEQAKVPVIAGFNEGEVRSFPFLVPAIPESRSAYEAEIHCRFGAHASDFLAVYPGIDPKADILASIRDGLHGWSAQFLVRRQAAVGQPAYLYFFRHSTPAQRARDLEAFHGSELPYLFGQVGTSAALGPNWPRAPLTRTESLLTEAMMSYWASFVRDGSPKAAGMAPWPRFTRSEHGYLDIGDLPSAARDLHPDAFGLADRLIEERQEQGRGWRFDIGFSAYRARHGGEDGRPDAAGACGQPEATP